VSQLSVARATGVRNPADDRTARDSVDEIIHLAHPEFTPGYIASAMGRVP
jgi:hypothetical protein